MVKNSIDVLVGKRIRLRRLELSISQSQLAEEVGLTFQQIQKYEKGTNRVSGSRLVQIASALEVKLAYFFGQDAWEMNSRDCLTGSKQIEFRKGEGCCRRSCVSEAALREPKR
jgi:transcriptional regulator with XRE-family HTH domain